METKLSPARALNDKNFQFRLCRRKLGEKGGYSGIKRIASSKSKSLAKDEKMQSEHGMVQMEKYFAVDGLSG